MSEVPDPVRPKYRPDIDGLRGLAVLAVVGFHAFPGLMHAGFIGVDVFFVISGFLITTIILGALERGNFTFSEFYARRVRRILPSLIVILSAVFVIGWFVLAADEYRQSGLHIVGGATFSSNFMLWRESGYFDTDSERKVLLHLWSLAVEEQFYLLFPIVLYSAFKRRLRPLIFISVIGLVSFIWNVLVAAAHPSTDFYSPQTRVWELMLGALLAYASLHSPSWLSRLRAKDTNDNLGTLASISGMILLLLGAVFIVKGSRFPGWWALLPTLGTFLLIFGGTRSWINRRILSNRMLVWFGLISFPLYLWHWPLLSFAYIKSGGTPSWTLKLSLVAFSIILAWLTYRFVEKPLRFGNGGRSITVSLLICLASLGLIGFSVYWSNGFESRAIARKLGPYLKTAKSTVDYGGCVPLVSDGWLCKLGVQSAAPIALMYGDSHAYSMRPVLAKYAYESGRSILYTGVHGCLSLLGVHADTQADQASRPCSESGNKTLAYVKGNNIPNVILIVRWTNYINDHDRNAVKAGTESRGAANRISGQVLQDGLEQTIEAYRKIGVHVYLFVDNPLQKVQPEDALRKSLGTDDTINAFSITTAENASEQGWMARLLTSYAGDSVTVLDFTDAYCPKNICPLVKDGKFLYLDHDHLSTHGSLLIYPELKKSLKKM